MTDRPAFGIGSATINRNGTVLDTWYAHVAIELDGAESLLADVGSTATGTMQLAGAEIAPGPFSAALNAVAGLSSSTTLASSTRVPVITRVDDLSAPPIDAHDVYLRLHLLSHRALRPHEANLDGAFELLTNVAWTNFGPVAAADLTATRLALAAEGRQLHVASVDKFPRMTDYVVPSGVRIADANRVRLGAHLAEGTTVMHEGFVNFNAGTLGASMVEGRISAGVVIGDGSDIGGGASTMGTLSGGGNEVISVGQRCLIGANAGIGISLGDDCIVEAGLYVTAGTKVAINDTVVAARELSGHQGLLYRRDSQTGQVVALRRDGVQGTWSGLNTDLHAHN